MCVLCVVISLTLLCLQPKKALFINFNAKNNFNNNLEIIFYFWIFLELKRKEVKWEFDTRNRKIGEEKLPVVKSVGKQIYHVLLFHCQCLLPLYCVCIFISFILGGCRLKFLIRHQKASYYLTLYTEKQNNNEEIKYKILAWKGKLINHCIWIGEWFQYTHASNSSWLAGVELT